MAGGLDYGAGESDYDAGEQNYAAGELSCVAENRAPPPSHCLYFALLEVPPMDLTPP